MSEKTFTSMKQFREHYFPDCEETRDKELAEIREMRKEYKSMPMFIDGERNYAKTGLYHRIEMKMRAFDMKDKYR